MHSIGESKFQTIQSAIQGINPKTSHDCIREIRLSITNNAPDINTLCLSRLYNKALEDAYVVIHEHLRIDIEHITNLIELRKTAVYFKSMLLNCIDFPDTTTFAYQLNLNLIHKARRIALEEKNSEYQKYYIEYFNREIIDLLSTLLPGLVQERIDESATNAFAGNTYSAGQSVH